MAHFLSFSSRTLTGNKRFREIINGHLDEYTRAPGKSEKSRSVTKALNIVRKASPMGAFVKFEKGKWFEVPNQYAREKVQCSITSVY